MVGEAIYEQKEVSWSRRGEVISLEWNVEAALALLFLSLWETMAPHSQVPLYSPSASPRCPEQAVLPLYNPFV